MRLILVRGLPGSGKSTHARSLGILHLEADQYFMRNGEYKFDPMELGHAHSWCIDSTEAALKAGMDVVVANTFTEAWELKHYIDLAAQYDADLEIRKMTGQYESIHDIPAAAMQRMQDRWENIEGEKA